MNPPRSRQEAQGGRLRALVHRLLGARGQVMVRMDGLTHIQRTRIPRHGPRRDRLRQAQRRPGRLRPRDGEPRRHRQADHLRRDLHRHPRHRRRLGGLATQVVALDLVTADGSILHARPRRTRTSSPRPASGRRPRRDQSLTLQCVPAFLLRAQEMPLPSGDVLTGFDETLPTATITSSSTGSRTPTSR